MDGVTSVYDAWHVIFRVRKRVCRRERVLQGTISLSGKETSVSKAGSDPQGE